MVIGSPAALVSGAVKDATGVVAPSPAPATEVAIVADAVGFCRLVADRITPADLGAQVSGAAGAADVVLAGAAALALD